MKTLIDVMCNRCHTTVSCMWFEPAHVQESHVCPDGERSPSFSITERVVPGPGEQGKDEVEP